MNLLRLIFCMWILSSCHAQKPKKDLLINKDDNTLLWEITGNNLKKPSYLFGTFHMLCKDDVQFSPRLKQAIKNADKVYFELDLDDPSVLVEGLTMISMKNGKKLKDFYSPEEYDKVQIFFKDSLEIPLMLIENTKPYFLMAMLYRKMIPCKNISGVEQELIKLAKTIKKEIKGLETMEFQISVFDSIPYQKQATELLKAIDSIDSYKKYFDMMVTVYKSQQLNKMENLFNDDRFGMMDSQELLLNNRNKSWVKELKSIMKKHAVFVAVGAGHLVGEQGLIALLRKEGYALRPINN